MGGRRFRLRGRRFGQSLLLQPGKVEFDVLTGGRGNSDAKSPIRSFVEIESPDLTDE